MQPAANRWVASRRHLMVRNLFQEFFVTFDTFVGIYEHYITRDEASFEEIDRLVGNESRKGLLWRLKDSSHRLWRDADPKEELHGRLLDWALGSLFHEAMKLKENAYMYKYYRPLVEELQAGHAADCLRFGGVEGQRFIERTGREIRRQMLNIASLFNRGSYLLRLMLPEQAGNALLVRFLLEEEEGVASWWGEGLDALFVEMYPLMPETGYCLAAASYLDDQWYEQARQAYRRALAVNGDCEEAHRRLFQLRPAVQAPGPAPTAMAAAME